MDRKEQVAQDQASRIESKISINKLILPNKVKPGTSPRMNSLPAKRASDSSSSSGIEYNKEDDDYEGRRNMIIIQMMTKTAGLQTRLRVQIVPQVVFTHWKIDRAKRFPKRDELHI